MLLEYKRSFCEKVVALKRAVFGEPVSRLLGLCVLGDGLGALRDGVLGQLTRQQQTDGGLDLAGGDGGAAVVVSQTGGLGSDALEDVVDEGVHDAHGLGRDASVGMHLLQHLVDVDGVALPPSPSALLVRGTGSLGLGHGLLGSLRCGFGWHDSMMNSQLKALNDDAQQRPQVYIPCKHAERVTWLRLRDWQLP